MIAWPHVDFLSKHISEGFPVFYCQSRVLFCFGVTMDIFISDLFHNQKNTRQIACNSSGLIIQTAMICSVDNEI